MSQNNNDKNALVERKGDEKIVCGKDELGYTMCDFWRWAYSNIEFNMNRGTFADFLVRCALEKGGVKTREVIGTGFESYDLEGPDLDNPKLKLKQARIEVKSAAYIQTWRDKPSKKISFGISKARVKDENGDYKKASPKRRNNDLYVFCLYKAQSNGENIMDVSKWDFYVYPTYKINENPSLEGNNTISKARLEKLGVKPVSFRDLCDTIKKTVDDIAMHFKNQ